MQNLQTQRLLTLQEDAQIELKRMQDTHLLLTNLAEREKATVTAILDSLYEVGSARLINQKVSVKSFRGSLKGIARLSKPVFRLFAWRWFRKNSPWLITRWLFDQVRFGDNPPLLEAEDADLIEVVPNREMLPPLVEKQSAEILALRSRVSWLTATVVILTLIVCWNTLVS